jgi:hypothetical protein
MYCVITKTHSLQRVQEQVQPLYGFTMTAAPHGKRMGKEKGLLMVASVGPEIEPVLVGVRDYSVRKLILLHTVAFKAQAQEIIKRVKPILVETEARQIKADDVLMDTLRQVSDIQSVEGLRFRDVIINVSSGDKMQTCSALSAAFVHGIPAIGVGSKIQLQ